jgi:hypothetical protein
MVEQSGPHADKRRLDRGLGALLLCNCVDSSSRMREFDGAPIANAPATSQRLSNIRVSIPAEKDPGIRPELRTPTAAAQTRNSLCSQNSAGFPQICAIFQSDNLRRRL